MTLSIIGDQAKEALLPASLFALSKELAIALDEWSGTPSLSLDSIRSLDDVEIDRQKLCEYIAYAMFRSMAEKELLCVSSCSLFGAIIGASLYDKKLLSSIVEENDKIYETHRSDPFHNMFKTPKIRSTDGACFTEWEQDSSFLSCCKEAQVQYLLCVYKFFEKMREKEKDFSPLPTELTPQVDDIKSAIANIMKDSHGRCDGGEYYYDIKSMARQIQVRFGGIDPYAFLSTLFIRFDVNEVLLDSTMRESGLNIEGLTWRILTQAAKESKTQNLKDFFTELFPYFTDEDMSYISGLITPHASDEELLKAPLELDDEYRDELEIEAVFKGAYNFTQELEDSLHKFESQILIKSKAFEDCSKDEQDFIESLRAKSATLCALFPTLEEIARDCPTAKSQRAKKRLCMQAIHTIQDSLSLESSDNSAKEAQDSHRDSPKDS